MNSSETSVTTLTWPKLLLIFLLMLLLFVALRWQPDAWVASRIDRMASEQGITLSYDDLKTAWFSVEISNLTFQKPGMRSPLPLDVVRISPDWGALSGGDAGLHLVLPGKQLHGSMDIAMDGGRIKLAAIDLDLSVAQLLSLIRQQLTLPVKAGGRIMINGDLNLDATSGKPQSGEVHARWETASIDLPVLPATLGDYALLLHVDPKGSGHWQWQLTGGTALQLDGHGAINAASADWMRWPVNGSVQLGAGAKAPALAAMFGGKKQAFAISGIMSQPNIQPAVAR